MPATDKNVDVNDTKKLVEQSRAGCREAFDKLVRIYQKRAMQTALRISGDINDAAEAVQAGFVKAYLNIKKLKKPARFEAWLLRIITNTTLNQRRKQNRPLEKINIETCENEKVTSPRDTADAEELKQAIQKAMAKLTRKEAKAISLFGLQDLPHKQVAEIMNCSVESARWHVHRARKKLKVFLKDYIK